MKQQGASRTAEDRYKWKALVACGVGTFIAVMDIAIMNIALPPLSVTFEVSPSAVLWVTMVFTLVTSGLMLTIGRIGDVRGRKRVYLLGLLVFSLGLGFSALAQSFFQLILGRAVQAIGGAMVMALTMALVTTAFPIHERGKALGIMGAVVGAAAASAPTLGGFLLDSLGWRSLFYTRLPAGLLALLLALAFLREERPAGSPQRLDLWGAATLFGAVSSLLVVLNQGGTRGWTSALILGLSFLTVLFLVIFLLVETRVLHPVVDLTLFRQRLFSAANGSLFLSFFGMSASGFLMPFYLIQARGFSPSRAGLILMTLPLGMLVVSPVSGWLSDRIGSRFLSSLGLALVSGGLVLLGQLNMEASVASIVFRYLPLGIGIGLFQSPNNSTIMGAVPGEKLGTASALTATLRNMGVAVGTALGGAIFSARQAYHSAHLAPGSPASLPFLGGFHDALLISAAITAIGAFTSWVRGPARRR